MWHVRWQWATVPGLVGRRTAGSGGAIVTVDAMHAQCSHATYLAGHGAHYLFTIKRNQHGLFAQLAALPWRQGGPVACDTRERGHGRAGRRTLKITAVAAGLAFPHAARAIQAVRRSQLTGKKRFAQTSYAITSLTATQGGHAGLAAVIRGHRAIKDRPHCVRDMDYLTGPLPGPHRQRPRIIAAPPQPRHHHLAAGRPHQHRRRHPDHARRPDRPPRTIMNCQTTLPGPAPKPARSGLLT